MKKIVVIFMFLLAIVVALSVFCINHLDNISSLTAVLKQDKIEVVSNIEGTVEGVYIENNSYVEEGQIIAKLNQDEYQKILDDETQKFDKAKKDLKISKEDVEKMNFLLNQSKTKIDEAKQNLENANNDYIRYKNAFKDGVVTKNDLDMAVKNLDVATKQYKNAQAVLRESDNAFKKSLSENLSMNDEMNKLLAKVETAKLNLSNTTILAPKDGIVTDLNLKVNKKIDNDEKIFSIADDKYYINAKFKEETYSKISVGQDVFVKIKNVITDGKISSIEKDNTVRVILKDDKIINEKKYNTKTRVKVYIK